MIKIIEVINTMITNSAKISQAIFVGDEFFFLYDNKYIWSILEKNNTFFLYLYPQFEGTTEDLVRLTQSGETPVFVSYFSSDYKSKEATESFKDLMQLMKNKVYGIDQIFEDILLDGIV